MDELRWGLLGPEVLPSERRTRTLGVGSSVRNFNDLAVPGLGGVWFGKQLFFATLGVAVAERVRAGGKRVQNIETANAIEALACWLALQSNGWKSEARLRGKSKMQGKNDLSFAVVRKREFYVTQPMRMATVQSLPALGLVEVDGSRFNAFACSKHGHDFIEALCADYNPCHYRKSIFDYLVGWALGDSIHVANKNLLRAISPLEPMAKSACEILRERLIQGGHQESQMDKVRRRSALAWVESLRSNPNQKFTWEKETKPMYMDDAHWQDLHVGALFFSVRDSAIRLLDKLEAHIGSPTRSEQRFPLDDPIPNSIKAEIQSLRGCAQDFLAQQHNDELATTFCRELANDNDATLLASLVGRDERVLRLRDRIVLPGLAFRESQAQESNANQSPADEVTEPATTNTIEWPEGISHRVRNLFLLNADLHGELSKWLGEKAIADAGEEQ